MSKWISRYYLYILVLLLLNCACSLVSPAASSTQPAVSMVNFAVTVIVPNTATPTATLTPTTTSSPIPIPTLSPSPTFTLTPTATPTPPSVLTDIAPAAVMTNTLALTPTSETASIVSPPPAGPPPPAGSIELLAPENNTVLAANMNELEFKWTWHGDMALERCQGLLDYGFEVRIWPAQDGFGPLGAMDAAKNKEDPSFGCNAEKGIYTYMLKYLQSKPGVKAVGAGKFLWDVTLVHLNPYQPLVTTTPRLFEISFDYHGSLDPFGAKLSCTNFGSWAEAQAVFLAAGGPGKDPHELDPDGEGQVCNELLGQ